MRDIEAKAHAWADILGMPVPPITVTDPMSVAHTEYRGQPTSARAKLAFFRLGQVSLELIEPIGEPSIWRDQLNQHGESLHHIAFEVKEMKSRIAFLESKDMLLMQRGDYAGGRYAYIGSAAKLGAILELLERD